MGELYREFDRLRARPGRYIAEIRLRPFRQFERLEVVARKDLQLSKLLKLRKNGI